MVWILGFVALLLIGVILSSALFSTEAPQRKSRPPLAWRKTAPVRRGARTEGVASLSASSDADALGSLSIHAYTSHAPDAVDCGDSTEDSSSACDTGSDASGDSGDCGSGGGSFD